MTRPRTAGLLLLLGAGLFLARSRAPAVDSGAPPALEVVVPEGAGADEVAAAIDEAVLVDLAVREGWAERDPVVLRRLADNLAFADQPGDAAARVRWALDAGMHRSDRVARRRLAWRARAVLGARVPEPTDTELEAWLAAHPERFALPMRVDLEHRFLARDRRGDALEADAAAVLAGLVAGEPARTDPMPLLPARGEVAIREVRRLLGPAVGDAVAEAPRGRWVQVPSAYGVHLFRVHAITPERLPPLDTVRDRVEADWRHDRRAEAVARTSRALRAAYRIEVVSSR